MKLSAIVKCNKCHNVGHLPAASVKRQFARSAQPQLPNPPESADSAPYLLSEASSYQLPMLAQSPRSAASFQTLGMPGQVLTGTAKAGPYQRCRSD